MKESTTPMRRSQVTGEEIPHEHEFYVVFVKVDAVSAGGYKTESTTWKCVCGATIQP